MKEVNVETWNRKKNYEWFKTFSNATYGCNVVMDVTKLVQYSKRTATSFFVNMLYVVMQGLNATEEMRLRFIDGKPYLFDEIHPSYTVMTQSGTFENVRHQNYNDYPTFYKVCKQHVDSVKVHTDINGQEYNPVNRWDEYYITCVPWISYASISHPIPDDVQSQCVPRVCWDRYRKNGDKYELTLNITVNHILVDGYPLSQAFVNVQKRLDDVDNLLK